MPPCMGTEVHILAWAEMAAHAAKATQAARSCRVKGRVSWAASQARRSGEFQAGWGTQAVEDRGIREAAGREDRAGVDRCAALECRAIVFFIGRFHLGRVAEAFWPRLRGPCREGHPGRYGLKLGTNAATHTSCRKAPGRRAARGGGPENRQRAGVVPAVAMEPDIRATARRRGRGAAERAGSL